MSGPYGNGRVDKPAFGEGVLFVSPYQVAVRQRGPAHHQSVRPDTGSAPNNADEVIAAAVRLANTEDGQ